MSVQPTNISDSVSRKFKGRSVHTEWSLATIDFRKVIEYAVVPPDIDLFASPFNKKLDQFNSWSPCKNART